MLSRYVTRCAAMMNENKPLGVYASIAKVMSIMATHGIGKDRANQQQGYKFRGIDDMYNSLSRPMCDAGLVVLPRVLSRNCVERVTAKGSPIFYTDVECEFDFVCVADGSMHTVKTYGEAMDNADKSTNKAMSAAYKYACMQVFCIPTEGDNDADGQTHEITRFITQAQEANITALAREVGVDPARIVEKAGVASLSEIPAASYNAIIKKLEASRK